jgi:hypothetical protein
MTSGRWTINAMDRAARRMATITEYHTIRRRERCPTDLVGEVPARPESLFLAADSSPSLFQEKEDNGWVLRLPAMEKGLPQASKTVKAGLIILLLIINAVHLSRRRNPALRVQHLQTACAQTVHVKLLHIQPPHLRSSDREPADGCFAETDRGPMANAPTATAPTAKAPNAAAPRARLRSAIL